MMALEEIAVADIRKGQKILVVYKLPGSVIDLTHSAVFESEGDELEKKWAADTKFYLLEDVPTPLFEVPWGTVQRDKDGDLWEFFKKVDRYGFVGHDHHRTRMYLNEAAEFAPSLACTRCKN